MTENKGHVHAALMMQYAQDAAETDKPWERWQMQKFPIENWVNLTNQPLWCFATKYRRKPQTKKYILELPEPMREEPKIGDKYWIPSSYSGAAEIYWTEKSGPLLEIGFVFKTKEEALAVTEALKNRQPVTE